MDVIEQLRERRSSVVGEMQTLSQQTTWTTETRARFDELEAQLGEIDGDIGRHERQREREQRAAEARAANGQTGANAPGARENRSGWSVTNEPTTYGRHAGHSYFYDLARVQFGRGDGDGGPAAAQERLNRHRAELDVELPRRQELRAQAAARAMGTLYEESLRETRNPVERRALEMAIRNGPSPFERERRALNRTDGTGGYLVPPLWLLDELVPFIRAGRNFADLWRGIPLPSGTDSINIPRMKVGAATGPQQADGGDLGNRDPQDAFVNAQVMTIGGYVDVGLQLLEQSPIGIDEILIGDLTSDYNSQLCGQLLVGAGNSQMQLPGVWPSGVISTANGIYIANTNNATGQTWVNGGSSSVVGSVWQGSAQMLSIQARTRMRPPSHWVWNPWMWYFLLSQVDGNMRPLVVPGTPDNIGYNQAAVDSDGPVAMGPVGFYQGLPVVLEPNVPTTFGASGVQPSMQTLSAGQFSPTAGAGSYTPLLGGLWSDCLLWEGDLRTRVLQEVLSGSLQVRFQAYAYVAAMPNRYQAYSTVQTGSSPTTVANASAPVSFATLTQFESNGVLSMMNQGF